MLDVEEASEDDTSGDTVQEPEEREKDLQKTWKAHYIVLRTNFL